jgi:hypothetical protein
VTQITSVDARLILPISADNGTTQASASSEPTAQSTDQPAVIVSLRGAASPSQQLPEVNPDEVNRTLASLGAANGFAWAYEHFDWDAFAKEAGAENANEQKAIKLQAFTEIVSNAKADLANNPTISVHQIVNPDATNGEPSKTIFTVSDFSFTYQGSAYSVTHAKNDLLIGTKDGQGWGSWQIMAPPSASGSDAGAAIALDTLTSLAPGQNPKSAPETPDRVDITA